MITFEIDSVANAKKVTVPAVFILMDSDTVVPVNFQQQVVDAYAGPKQVIISHGDHNTILTPDAVNELAQKTDWLWQDSTATVSK